jgi:cyclase
MSTQETVLENEHFRVEQLADGVFAAIKALKGGAGSNAGIVDLGDETLVFDAFMTRAAAMALRAAAEQLTGRAPRYLVNSHGHGDHVAGNGVFLPEAGILGSAQTAAMMTAQARASIDPAELAASIRELEKAVAEAPDEDTRKAYESTLYSRRWVQKELPVQVVPPTVILDGRRELRGSKRTVELVSVGRAHTAGDIVLLCPADRVAFIGDLGFFTDRPPYIAPEGDAEAWSSRLTELAAREIDRYVPGHGAVGGAEQIEDERAFLDAVADAAREVAAGGGSFDDLTETLHATAYARWEGLPFYAASLRSALEQAVSRGSDV